MRVRDLFEIQRGQGLDLNTLTRSSAREAVNYVSNSSQNNGVSARVLPIEGLEPSPSGSITISLAGSALETFLQPAPFYSSQNISILTPKRPMTDQEKLWWVLCIRANIFRFSFGRKANTTHANLELPDEMPDWATATPVPYLDPSQLPSSENHSSVMTGWDRAVVSVSDLFDIGYGHSLELNALTRDPQGVNFVSRSAKNNGVAARVAAMTGVEPGKPGDITVALSGSVLETFVQPDPFYTSFHVAILTPRRWMSLEEKLWWAMCIRAHQYRYSYGRQANRTLRDLALPDFVPDCVTRQSVPVLLWTTEPGQDLP